MTVPLTKRVFPHSLNSHFQTSQFLIRKSNPPLAKNIKNTHKQKCGDQPRIQSQTLLRVFIFISATMRRAFSAGPRDDEGPAVPIAPQLRGGGRAICCRDILWSHNEQEDVGWWWLCSLLPAGCKFLPHYTNTANGGEGSKLAKDCPTAALPRQPLQATRGRHSMNLRIDPQLGDKATNHWKQNWWPPIKGVPHQPYAFFSCQEPGGLPLKASKNKYAKQKQRCCDLLSRHLCILRA